MFFLAESTKDKKEEGCMISKGEAIARLKKMGMMVADDQSIVTILLPSNIPLSVGIKDIKEKLKGMEYNASFSIRHSKDAMSETVVEEKEVEGYEEPFDQEDDMELLSEEDLKGSLLSMDDDGQFTLGGFGLNF